MAGRECKLLTCAALGALTFAAAAYAQQPAPGRGALYPVDVMAAADSAQSQETTGAEKPTPLPRALVLAQNAQLAQALGPAAFILNDIGASNAFQSLIRRAVGRHPAYHRQASTLDESRAERKRARAALYPQLSTQIAGDYVIKRDFAADTDNVVESLRPSEQYSASISASQLVFDGGATFQRIKSARARHSEFKNALSTRINDLSFAALAAYHDLLTHRALLALGEAFARRHEQILGDVKERERLGSGSMTDVARATARLAAARARVSEIRESARMAEVRYLEFFKEEPGALARPSFVRVAVDSRDAAIAAAGRHNPEIAVASARVAASQAEFKAAKGARLPELRVSVDAVKYDLFDSGDDFDVRAGVNLNYNIFGGGARAADIAQAGSRARQAKFGEAQIREEVARDAAIAFERREGADERLKALETAVIAHDTTRDMVLERYRAARGDLIDVLQSENDYFEAGVAYLSALANHDMAVYGLMEHTGDLLRYFSPQEEFADFYKEGVDG